MAASKTPTLVLVHGAWHCPEQYLPLTDRLSKANFKVKAVRLPSVSPPKELESFALDVEVIRNELQAAVDLEEDVVVVCHSYGGCPSGEAAKGFLKKDREEQGLKGGIITMVYMCAFAPDAGQSLPDCREIILDVTPVEPAAVLIDKPAEVFYNDLDADTIAEIIPKLGSQSGAALISKVSFAPWRQIQCTYILCEQDLAIGLLAQERMTDPSRGGKWTVHRMNASHSPFLSKPGEVVDIVQQAIKQAYA